MPLALAAVAKNPSSSSSRGTTDRGSNWFPFHDNDPRIHGVNSIAVDPRDHDIIYITSTNSLSFVSSYCAGVFKSTDGGFTWDTLLSFPDRLRYPTPNANESARKIIFHPRNPDTLLFINPRRLDISIDGGSNWDQIFFKYYYNYGQDTSLAE